MEVKEVKVERKEGSQGRKETRKRGRKEGRKANNLGWKSRVARKQGREEGRKERKPII